MEDSIAKRLVYEDRKLAVVAIQSLGFSGRPEVATILAQFQQRSENPGGIVDAAFFKEMVESNGREATMELWMSGKFYDAFTKWKTTTAGSDWGTWSASVRSNR